ncbi:outer membrane beta-barrel protein [Flavobacterium foetidum]|uniref:outer membrane beta-barrel protein n=1 Tax=Flavobacterium foetidum TaxID=2026681 RepID=UPI001074D398|nr:outer membrane beta-barrel protein [Flavobacterium foetidum]KAF2517698.1 outer membrane beta-barrel protein [Flavobacterium foetidum]
MNKKLLLLFFFIIQSAFSQQFEFGVNLSYGFTNIANSRISEGRAVIGDALWNINEGISVLYYFSDPKASAANGIHFEFTNSKRGSKSETTNGEYSFKAKSLNLNYRRSGTLGNNFRIYADMGFGYNFIDNVNIYKGNIDELTAFEKVNQNLTIKNNEITFVFALGADKVILKDKFVVFFEVNGDAGITKINENSGSYRTQSFGLSTGIRYIVKTTKTY